jgi:N-acetylated-alpha-linked acidic dipeptidase
MRFYRAEISHYIIPFLYILNCSGARVASSSSPHLLLLSPTPDHTYMMEKEHLLPSRPSRDDSDEQSKLEANADHYGHEEDDDAQFFQQASQSSRSQRFKALLIIVASAMFFYSYVIPILPSIPVELTPDGLRTPGRRPGTKGQPCPHAKSGRHIHGFMHNVKLAMQQTKGVSSLENILDPSAIEKIFEKLYLLVPTAESARDSLQGLTSVTHVAGTKGDYDTAISVLEQWGNLLGAKVSENSSEAVFEAGSPESIRHMTSTRESRGEEGHGKKHHSRQGHSHPLGEPTAWVDTYSVWLNYPISSSLTLSKANETSRPYFRAALKEDVLLKDPTSSDGLPTFHGYSKTGKASGKVVYAALCTKQDFDRLEELDISVAGAIVLCRYGGPFRGLKVRLSAERGAVGTLIYSDPLEDGDVTEKNGLLAYPEGPARNPSSVQRGSVQAISIYPGDAATPGAPSYRNATRIDPADADPLPAIPSLPISYKDALPFLQALSGKGKSAKEVGNGWQGAVPGVEEYWTGPSEDVVEMDNQMTDIATPTDIWNTYAKIPGVIEDELVIISNHRDAWTFGAGDPSSGTAVIHEVVKGLGTLVKKGWRPMRTILIANWDAEEYGLIGSTEAAEDYPEYFKEKAAIFLNLDVGVAGSMAQAGASPSLVDLIVNAASEVADPSGNGTTISLEKPRALGSGSDYTAFLQNLGIASADLGFQAGPSDAIYHYHSNYDSFHWMKEFGDPLFARSHAMALWMGLVTLRSAQGLFLPLNITNYASALDGYLKKVEKIAPKGLDLRQLRGVISTVVDRAGDFEAEKAEVAEKIKRVLARPGSQSHRHHKKPSRELRKLFTQVRSINKRAMAFETSFLSKDGKGLHKRPFYQHLGVAPGRYLGYGATTFPGLTESITLDGGEGTQHEIERLVDVLRSLGKSLKA